MKGVVFNILEEMVLDQGGVILWQKVLDDAGVSGAYTAVETYSDEELFALVGAVSEAINVPAGEIVKAFGEYMFGKLASSYPEFVEKPDNLFEFLDSIDSVIHLEVRKLLTETHLPKIVCSNPEPGLMVMDYRSPRKLCILAEGLVQGAASHYGEPIELEHPICMHKGSDHCELRVKKVS